MKRSFTPLVTGSFLWAGYTDSMEDGFIDFEKQAKTEESEKSTDENSSDPQKNKD